MIRTIINTFQIADRGTVIVLAGEIGLRVGHEYSAEVTKPDGSILTAPCFKEWLLRKAVPLDECEAFLLTNISKDQVPIGSTVRFDEE